MKGKNAPFVLIAAVILGSCGQNSTKKSETDTDTLTTTTTPGTSTDVVPNTSTVTSITVPEKIAVSFREKYPDVRDVTWSRYEPYSSFDWEWAGWPVMDTADYVARFNYNNADYYAWYDNDYNWVGSVTPIVDFKTLPAPVNKVIGADYAGYTIESVDKEFDKNRTAYEIDLVKGTDKMKILVDENGKILKKKTVTDGVKTKEKVDN